MGSSRLTPEQRTQRARIAAHSRWAHEDPTLQADILHKGFFNRFLNEVDEDRVLPEAERIRRAESALRAHMYRLALKSSRARSKAGDAA